jgi:hypothetical protein
VTAPATPQINSRRCNDDPLASARDYRAGDLTESRIRRAIVAGDDFRSWPIATNFSLGSDVSFRGEAEVGRAAEPSAAVENDPYETLAIPHF